MTAKFFEPSLSYRLDETAGGIRDFGVLKPGGRLSQYRAIVFLVHGYNNDQKEASGAYEKFVVRLGVGATQLIGVYWPGDNWGRAGGLYYVGAVDKVRTIARRFARDIHDAAAGAGSMDVSFVAHSLGCRLTLETLRELRDLLRNQPLPGLKIRRVVFMAGAVPTFYLQSARPLNAMIRDLSIATKSLYSEADRVLHYAFPLGQTAIGQGLFPVALGRTEWQGSVGVNPAMQQKENPRAGHSDYWGGESSNEASLKTAASEVRAFIPFGQPFPARATPVRATTTERVGDSGRQVPIRTL